MKHIQHNAIFFTIGIFSLFFSICVSYAAPIELMHAKVICSSDTGYVPKDSDKPTNFQPYTSKIEFKKYTSGNQTCYALIGYTKEDKDLVEEVAFNLTEKTNEL